jgi:hypothetical protein
MSFMRKRSNMTTTPKKANLNPTYIRNLAWLWALCLEPSQGFVLRGAGGAQAQVFGVTVPPTTLWSQRGGGRSVSPWA